MKKILLSILAIALTVGTVSASAYALFNDKVEVAGVTITSGNADLVIYDGGTQNPIQSVVSGLNTKLQNLYPGFVDYAKMDFVNNSKSDIKLKLTGQLTSINGHWSDLYNQIEVAIVYDPSNIYSSLNLPESGKWHTLGDWSTGFDLDGGLLDKTTPKTYEVYIRVKDTATSEQIANKWLSGNLVFTGTQAE
jgi:hypothetical protein